MAQAPHPRMHGLTHVPGGADPIPGLLTGAPAATFYDAVMALSTSNSLRGYWRLGEGGGGPYADSSGTKTISGTPVPPAPMSILGAAPALTDIDPGALPAGQDDGAVQFNSSTGAGNYLEAANVWGTGALNPFEGPIGTVAGWVKPAASASTFDGGIFSMLAVTGTFPTAMQGYSVGVAWPSRSVFYQIGLSRLTGPVLTADEWVFVVAVHDGTSNRIYLNGALVTTGAALDPTPSTNINPTIGLWNHSVGVGGVGAGVLYGAVDEVSVWMDALDATEIATLYDAGTDAGGGATGGVVVDSFSKNGAARLTGDVTISAGSNVTLTQTGQDVQIAAAAGGASTDTHAWMPLVDSDGSCVLDGTGDLIPTLIAI